MPLSPSATRDLLAKLNHQPKRFLGQNFLVDGNIVRKSLQLAGVVAGDAIVEIGPGLGTLTAALLEAGAEVWAVEKDRQLHTHLAATLGLAQPRLHLLEGDAVKHPLAGFNPNSLEAVPRLRDHPAGLAMPGEGAPPPAQIWPADRPFKVVANLPYAVATPWLDAVLSGPLPAVLVLMLQHEAAQRYAAQPGTKAFSAISIFLQAAYVVVPGHKVGAGCFYPKPDVESYLLNLVRRPAPFIFGPVTKALIRACFQQRRKQIGSLLRGKLPAGKAAAWLDRLAAAGLGPQARPEQIPVALWQQLPV